MNLIKQLGGYEKAKSILDDCPKFYHEYQPIDIGIYEKGYYRDSDVNRISMVKLSKALLQYRREHNIFEVGDLVVFTVDMSDIWDMEEIYRINEHSHGQYSVYRGDERICWCGDQVFHHEFRHPTSEEIQAKKRLEVA